MKRPFYFPSHSFNHPQSYLHIYYSLQVRKSRLILKNYIFPVDFTV
nr:MAG TPA: hypothetical protein [Caudoviricetes sp.]